MISWNVAGLCFAVAMVALALFGCAAGPAPIVIYEDTLDSVSVAFDPQAGSGHSHPASISPELMANVLRGVQVLPRDAFGGFGLLAGDDASPVFSGPDVTVLAPRLSQALAKASPKDMVTFYLTRGQAGRGRLITSGGLFIRNQHLYLILANARTSPSAVQYENTYEPDLRAQPLLPIVRFKFAVGYTPAEARIPTEKAKQEDGWEGYLDEAKVIVVDLSRLEERR